MDSQALFNVIVGVSGALGGWVLKTIWEAIKTLDNDVKALGRDMHTDYVKREDFKETTAELKADMRHGFSEVKSMLGEVFGKLDSKADK